MEVSGHQYTPSSLSQGKSPPELNSSNHLLHIYPVLSLTPSPWNWTFNPYPTAFPYGNGMVLHFYQQQESSTTKTVHKVIKKRIKTYV